MAKVVDGPWAKLTRHEDGSVAAALPLADHCLDVGVAMEALLAGGAWDGALAAAAGRPLTAVDRARLIALAALHDVGKANRGFQARADRRAENVGHTGQVAALFHHSRLRTGAAARALLDVIVPWGAERHFAAALAHHGRPLVEFGRGGRSSSLRHVDHWMPRGGHDPAADVLPVIAAVRDRWPAACEEGNELPDAARFVALFAGLVTLADWLGSDTRRFPVEGPHGPSRAAMRARQVTDAVAARGLVPLATPAADFTRALGFPPYGFQAEAAAADLGPVALVEAETGSGKTEAALWRWLELRRRGEVDGLFFALPTRSAAVQLHDRVNAMLRRVWGEDAPEAVLAVPGYLRAGDAEGQALPGWEVRWDDGEAGGAGDRRWAAESANRFLAARVAVGTIDQALLSALPVRHALFRAGVLARSLLVVDEVHASDAYMAGLLERLLDNHVAVGRRALLLSATLGAEARARFLKGGAPDLATAQAQPYPALSGRSVPPRPLAAATGPGKQVRIDTAGLIDDAAAIAVRAVVAARTGASVLVVRNTVAGAVQVAQAVEALAPDLAFVAGGIATLHHGRFAPDDRRLLDDAVAKAFGRNRPARGQVLVGTQTLEQSLDIDADFLVTDLVPMDVLLQRIGRLHRHPRGDRGAHAQARALVLRPAERDLTPLLAGRATGVYPNVVHLEATLRLLEAEPDIVIPRDNRRLVEQALHRHALDAIAADLGPKWISHLAGRAGSAHADRATADHLALDLGTRFDELHFPDDAEHAATRLGARDLLVDLDPPLAGPFGPPVRRVAIPSWMAGGVEAGAAPERLADDRFRLGGRHYRYDRWGLHAATG